MKGEGRGVTCHRKNFSFPNSPQLINHVVNRVFSPIFSCNIISWNIFLWVGEWNLLDFSLDLSPIDIARLIASPSLFLQTYMCYKYLSQKVRCILPSRWTSNVGNKNDGIYDKKGTTIPFISQIFSELNFKLCENLPQSWILKLVGALRSFWSQCVFYWSL